MDLNLRFTRTGGVLVNKGSRKCLTLLGRRKKQTNGKTFGENKRQNEVRFLTLFKRKTRTQSCFRIRSHPTLATK